jgi:uncharacterized protein YwqG
MMNKKEILELIKLKISNKEVLDKILLPSIGFNLTNLSNNKSLTHSKIGGYPLFLNEDWPSFNGNSLTFLGQIELNQINQINNILPKNGILYFFILTTDIGYRYPDKKGEYKVIYIEDPDRDKFILKTLNNPKIDINESIINFYESYTFPSYQESIIAKNNIQNEIIEMIDEIETEIIDSFQIVYDIEHQLLGHPKAIQGSVRFWWALKYLEIEIKNEYSKEEIAMIQAEEENFILLLQLNFGDSRIQFDYFGDSIAYFGIHRNDLLSKNFNNVILTMQNT